MLCVDSNSMHFEVYAKGISRFWMYAVCDGVWVRADEAEAALVAAGQKFRAVAERDQDDTRALGNWGRALCVRAELARDPEVRHSQLPMS